MEAIPPEVIKRIRQFGAMSQWERAELGRSLRRLGLSYGEIRSVIPVPKGTLSNWCRDVSLTPEQAEAIVLRTGSRRGVPRDTQWRRRLEVEKIRSAATDQVPQLATNLLWVAGTTMYWAEGTKAAPELSLANSDARALQLFIRWTREFHDDSAVFVLKLNLHAGNDELAAHGYWTDQLALPDVRFYKTYIKPEGTGHRRNHLPYGVCQVRVRRSTDHWHRTMAWIDVLGNWQSGPLVGSPAGR